MGWLGWRLGELKQHAQPYELTNSHNLHCFYKIRLLLSVVTDLNFTVMKDSRTRKKHIAEPYIVFALIIHTLYSLKQLMSRR